MRQKRTFIVLLLVVSLQINTGLAGNVTSHSDGNTPTEINNGTINVVASISIVADFAGQIGEGLFTVDSIVSGNENPHVYEPSPHEIEKVAQADLFVRLGLEGLEPWVQSVLDVNPGINVLELVNSSMIEFDDVINSNNPHVWMNPNNVKTMIEGIFQSVSLLDPTNIATYESNRNSYLSDLDLLLNRIDQAKVVFSGTKVVVHHPSFKYLFDLLGIIRVGAIEEQDGVEPSPDHLQGIISAIETENVTLIINQPQLDDETVNQIARDTEIQIANLTPLLGVYNLVDYISMIDYNILALKNPFNPPSSNLPWTTWFLIGFAGIILVILGVAVVIVRSKNPRE
ncbi:MAG: metal ABC transporter substrate-binding protein [Candidatus Heimdallarchaeota archaeon]